MPAEAQSTRQQPFRRVVPITRQLFVIDKPEWSSDQQAGVAYANCLLTNQRAELITEALVVLQAPTLLSPPCLKN